ncbi:SixA phosphatase family protein [Maribellus maritimus]|uniref:SixA phosphatase family protein n=1 Tax=Maribellus maritimus TaxID=2870838 RepID=UPI001EEC77AF|nr:histidine phosphatase family protein [Maribellus maritimus]MCG6186749.1 histidine phosphatase family protein [Maribellus maritimus]
MKRVVIVRHAKSVPYGYDDDFNRDLKERGKNDAKLVSGDLKRKGIVPDVMISSPAKRAIKTARIFADNLGFNRKDILKVKNIYDGQTTSEFLEMIKKLPENAETVFFFGHNPGFHYFASNLLQSFGGDMPTCSTVGIDFDIDSWKKTEARMGKKAFHLVPRAFK